MPRIEASVGHEATNRDDDVRTVQQLLNRQDLAPLAKLKEDGRSGPATVEAIRHFQSRCVGMSSPDGRVDPDGRTFRRLAGGSGERGTGQSPETRRADRIARAERVDPRVKENGLTTAIIDRLVPHLAGCRARIISGYLSDADLFWKLNYHWEYLLQMVDHSLTLPVDDRFAKELQTLASGLRACAPTPASGYTSGALGKPEDRSTLDEVKQRHRSVSSAKASFKRVVVAGDLKAKSRKAAHAFDLACAPVAFPGTSKHGSGYALDIEGDNSSIKSICNSHGATLVFDEQSHVHVEFRNGVA
jgi:peptidoglycan hydrolase-like protein with peptidoglycan-binding domain